MSEMGPPQVVDGSRQSNVVRDALAAVLLMAALLLPWNVYFGVGVAGSASWLFATVPTVTLLSGAALLIGRLRRGAPPAAIARLRLFLNAPYLAVVAAFIAFALWQAVSDGGDGHVPAGVGPGLLAGLAGALLAAQPELTGADEHWFGRWAGVLRGVGTAAMVAVTGAVLLNFYWRTRFVWPGLADATYGGMNVTVLAATLAYGLTAWITVMVALRWLRAVTPAAWLAVTALGASSVLGSMLVWSIGIGREVDAFHGIAQTTSTAGIGFEGYLAWVAAAAVVGPYVLRRADTVAAQAHWRGMVRMCLALIGIWCMCTAVLRILDLVTADSLGQPNTPYDKVALLAFDVVTAAGAFWLRFNLNRSMLHPAVMSAVSGVVFVLTVCRVVVGVGLAPRIMYGAAPKGLDTAVFGNMLAQQITCTFDVVLCWLALACTAVAVVVLQLGGMRRRVPRAVVSMPEPSTAVIPVGVAAAGPVDVSTTSFPSAPPAEATTAAVPARPQIITTQRADTTKIKIATPRAHGGGRHTKAAEVLAESTQRFAAGTTYTGSGQQGPPA